MVQWFHNTWSRNVGWLFSWIKLSFISVTVWRVRTAELGQQTIPMFFMNHHFTAKKLKFGAPYLVWGSLKRHFLWILSTLSTRVMISCTHRLVSSWKMNLIAVICNKLLHTSNATMKLLREALQDRVSPLWLPWSPDLMPLNFQLWAKLKGMI